MEFAEGVQVNDKDYLKKLGISVNEVPWDMVYRRVTWEWNDQQIRSKLSNANNMHQ